DLVPNHTSSAHPWFVDARSGGESAHRGYYIWADPSADGGPPNNWLSATGAPAWTFDGQTGQYYLHSFLASQPDLNWREPPPHPEVERSLRFWFDPGVAGFPVGGAHRLYTGARPRDAPPPAT